MYTAPPPFIDRLGAMARRTTALFLLAVTLWVPGLIWYVSQMPERVEDPHSLTDVIVVLTGGSERLSVGLDLLRQGKAPLLFVSGVHPGITLDDLLAGEPLPNVLKKRIVLGHMAADTVGNAMEAAKWMNERRLMSLRLVTSGYHMPRSLLEFRAALPAAIVIAHPVFPPHIKRDFWWSYPGTAELFASEFIKYLAACLRLMVSERPYHPAIQGTRSDQAASAPNDSAGFSASLN